MIKALLFDMDGTLVDDIEADGRAYREACEFYGYNLDENEKRKYHGMHFSVFLPKLIGEIDSEKLLKIAKKKKELYLKNAKFAKEIPHVIGILKKNYKDYRTAIVTTASITAVEMWSKLFGWDEYFDCVISGEDVKNKKPDPECYLLAMDRLGVKAEECLVFEDHVVGFEAVKNAGMKYVDINSERFKENVSGLLKKPYK